MVAAHAIPMSMKAKKVAAIVGQENPAIHHRKFCDHWSTVPSTTTMRG
jgi:hypothetical protein